MAEPSTWPCDWACAPMPTRARHEPTCRRVTRAWPTTSSGRISAPSHSVRSKSTRWSCRMSAPPWRPAVCGARRHRSRRCWIAAARRSMSRPRNANRWFPRAWPTHSPMRCPRTRQWVLPWAPPDPWVGGCRWGARREPPNRTGPRDSSATQTNLQPPTMYSMTHPNPRRCAPFRCENAAAAETSTAERHRHKPGS